MQVKIAVLAPILRLIIFVLTDTFQVTDIDAANTFLNTPFNDVFSEAMEEMGTALRPLRVQPSGFFTH